MYELQSWFEAVWLIDFEFSAPSGERPSVFCLVAKEYFSQRLIRIFAPDFGHSPPFSVNDRNLFIAYYATAEWSCFLRLGWPLPSRVLDLYVEFRNHTNGLETPAGRGLVGALEAVFRAESGYAYCVYAGHKTGTIT